jgi:hypothetical protein
MECGVCQEQGQRREEPPVDSAPAPGKPEPGQQRRQRQQGKEKLSMGQGSAAEQYASQQRRAARNGYVLGVPGLDEYDPRVQGAQQQALQQHFAERFAREPDLQAVTRQEERGQ